MFKKIVKGIAQQYGIGVKQCEFYCGGQAYAIVEGDANICKTCFGRLGSFFKKSEILG